MPASLATPKSVTRTSGGAGPDPEASDPGESTRTFFGLDVAVDDALGVAGRQSPEDLGSDARRRGCRERAVGAQVPPQVSALDEIAEDGEGLAVDDQIPDGDDVEVPDPRQDGPFLDESGNDAPVVGQFGMEDLRGEFFAGVAPGGPVDAAHRTAADGLVEQVALTKRRSLGWDVRDVRGHGISYTIRVRRPRTSLEIRRIRREPN